MWLFMLVKAVSGFIGPPESRKIYSLSKAQTNRSFVCAQLESMGTVQGSVRFRLLLPVDFPFSFSFAPFPDRVGPEDRAIWGGASAFGGTPVTWKDRDQ